MAASVRGEWRQACARSVAAAEAEVALESSSEDAAAAEAEDEAAAAEAAAAKEAAAAQDEVAVAAGVTNTVSGVSGTAMQGTPGVAAGRRARFSTKSSSSSSSVCYRMVVDLFE